MKKGTTSLEYWCTVNDKSQLLALYDTAANALLPSEIAFSSAKLRHWKCPICQSKWQQSTNKLVRMQPRQYNVFTKQRETTYCPYCKGERPSAFYNLLTEYPWLADCWDYERNDSNPQEYTPSIHKKVYIRCIKCGYAPAKPICPRDKHTPFVCPECSGGICRETTPKTCLTAKYPTIAAELVNSRNNGITGDTIRPSYNGKLWFRCEHGHVYSARVSNRTYLGRGCPICHSRHKTSFTEQAIYFYIQKCCSRTYNNHIEPHGHSVDIFLPEQRIAIECNSLYYHDSVKADFQADIKKYLSLAQYYRVYILTESEKEYLAIQQLNHPLIHAQWISMFSYSRNTYAQYEQTIYELLRTLFPELPYYPNINILRDQQKILAQYIHTPIKGSFADIYPTLAVDWDTRRNGALQPNLFRPTVSYLFFWICRSCGRSYSASMSNRVKINPDTCPHCCHKSRFKSPLLCESWPQLQPYWNEQLNTMSFFEVAVASEKTAIFTLNDGKIVPTKISAISNWLYSHPDREPSEYLKASSKRLEKHYAALVNTK